MSKRKWEPGDLLIGAAGTAAAWSGMIYFDWWESTGANGAAFWAWFALGAFIAGIVVDLLWSAVRR